MKKPIFIIGCPRSGTSMVLQIMALHEKLSWVSNFLNRKPLISQISILNRVYELPLIGKHLYFEATQNGTMLSRRIKRYFPLPAEPWNFWNSYLSNFQWERGGNTPPRRRTSLDITDQEINNIKESIDSLQQAQGKDRFISRYTDFPRMIYLTQAFPDALFVHIVRDGRAVAASYHKKIKSGQFGTWNEREWWIRGWPTEGRNKWQNQFGTPLSFVAFQWKFFVGEIFKDAEEILSEQYIEIKYSDIISSPIATLKEIFAFCKLKQSRRVEWYLNNISLENRNYKWKERYSDSDKRELDRVICEPEFRKLLNE